MAFRILKFYREALQVYPIRTAAVSAGTLMTLGDAIAQTVVEKKSLSQFEVKRSLRFVVFGTFMAGPLFSIWYSRLAKTFGHTKYAALKMVACDQLLFAPPFIAYFLGTMELFKGEGLQDVKLKLQDDYLTVMKTNYKLWPMVQALNFTFVPIHYRVVVVNMVAVGWNTYLAWMSAKVAPHKDSPVEDSDDNNNSNPEEVKSSS
ncbi:Protein Mpv17 [Mactra antiquata]